jgi:hypothetical protein
MAQNEPTRQRVESEYPAIVRKAGPRGMRFYDECVAALIEVGMSEKAATMIAWLHFPQLFARLRPADEPEE